HIFFGAAGLNWTAGPNPRIPDTRAINQLLDKVAETQRDLDAVEQEEWDATSGRWFASLLDDGHAVAPGRWGIGSSRAAAGANKARAARGNRPRMDDRGI